MNYVRGPFIEYDCTRCGLCVRANGSRKADRLVDDIARLNSDSSMRLCAGCDRPPVIGKAKQS